MPRPTWSGSISFGLVNIPIKLFPAIEPHRVAFHQFEEGSGERIRYKRVTESSGREVPWEKIDKGFEVAKDRYVVLSDDELEAAEPRKTHAVDIEQFVPLEEIDPVSFDQTYYALPDGEAAAKAYALLRDAMAKSGRVAVGRFVMRTKEYVVCIRPFQNILAFHTMFFPDEVRSPKDLGAGPPKSVVGARELAMAGQLIESLAGPWQPDKFQDTYKDRVLSLVKKKDKGAVIASHAEKPEAGQVLDLMAALKATLGQRGPGRSAPGGATARRPGAAAASARTRPRAAPRKQQRR